jgi:hypothetical protein
MFRQKNVLQEKHTPSPLHINSLIDNNRLSRNVFTLKAIIFVLKISAIVFILVSIALGLYFYIIGGAF